MPEIADWLPLVSAVQSIYSPLLATSWLPPRIGIPWVFPDVTAWADTRWVWKHGSEKWELLSGSDERAYFPS